MSGPLAAMMAALISAASIIGGVDCSAVVLEAQRIIQEQEKAEEASKYLIAIDAGHQEKGNFGQEPVGPGASETKTKVAGGTRGTATGVPEYQLTLDISLKLRDELEERGYSVLMIREDDDQQLDNIARTVLANTYADCHIAIHFDSTGSDKGAFFMSVPDALKYMDPVSVTWQKSEAFGEALISGLRGRGVKIFSGGSMDMDLTQTSYSTIPSIDIELGDKVTEHGDAACRKFAEALADGVEIYFN